MAVKETIETKLELAFSPETLTVRDDSEKHRGHAGWREGGETHFHVAMVSAKFEGKSRLQRQRAVYHTLSEELSGPVHALTLDLKAPGEG